MSETPKDSLGALVLAFASTSAAITIADGGYDQSDVIVSITVFSMLIVFVGRGARTIWQSLSIGMAMGLSAVPLPFYFLGDQLVLTESKHTFAVWSFLSLVAFLMQLLWIRLSSPNSKLG